MRLLRRIVGWWRGSADPGERREATLARDRTVDRRAEAAAEALSTRKQGIG